MDWETEPRCALTQNLSNVAFRETSSKDYLTNLACSFGSERQAAADSVSSRDVEELAVSDTLSATVLVCISSPSFQQLQGRSWLLGLVLLDLR